MRSQTEDEVPKGTSEVPKGLKMSKTDATPPKMSKLSDGADSTEKTKENGSQQHRRTSLE